jgi:small subunit ribosomal protein S6
MSYYEHVVVMRPDISPQQVEAIVEEITKLVAEHSGKVARNEYWGLRNLAYPIRKSRKAHYSLLNIDAKGEVLHEIERRHRINEDVLRYLTVRVDKFSEEPSPVVARKDRDDRRRRRDEEGGDRPDRGDRPPRRDRDDGDRPFRSREDRPPRDDGDRPPRPRRDDGGDRFGR